MTLPRTSSVSRSRSSPSLLLAGLVFLAAIAACDGGDKPSDNGEPALGAIPTVRTASEIVLPLDSYLPDDSTQRTISAAQNILLRQCVARFGLEFPISLGGDSTTSPNLNARRYFVFEEAKAQTDGYHLSREARDEMDRVAAERNAGRVEISSDVRNIVEGKGPTTFNGQPVPQGGCSKEAAAKLGGDGVDTIKLNVQGLRHESYGRMMADSRVSAVNALWSKCMKELGFDYPDPKAANEDRRWSADEPSKVEIDTAVADAKCKNKHNVVGVMLAVETAYQKRIIDQKAAELNEVKSLYTAQAANAAKVIASGGK